MRVALIDSGVDRNKFPKIRITQYKVDKMQLENEEAFDIQGHGTNMLGIILTVSQSQPEILSYRPVVHDGQLSNFTLATAIYGAVEAECKLINISMGNDDLFDRECVDQACEFAYQKGVEIICAFSNTNDIIVPWASPYTLKVIQGNGKSGAIQIKDYLFNSNVISVDKQLIRFSLPNGDKSFTMGHSAAAAFITGSILKLIEEGLINWKENLLNYKEGFSVYKKIETFREEPVKSVGDLKQYKRAAVIPFSKETESMINFREYTNIDKFVVGVEFGSYRNKVKLNISGKDLEIIHEVKQIVNYELDLIIIGYLHKLAYYYEDADYDRIIDLAIELKADIYTFLPLENKYKEKCSINNVRIYETVLYDKKFIHDVMYRVPFLLPPKKPILGVFGTSSKQGKYTLQMLIRNELDRLGIRYAFISTEHQAQFMGADVCFPYGYMAEKNIKISLEDTINVLGRLIYEVEQLKRPETFLVGGQSWLIPYNITKQTGIYNLAFLEATKPDYAIVLVNPEVDHTQYIQDTINTLIAVFKVRVIALAFSDKETITKKNATYRKKRTKENIEESAIKLSHKYKILAGCICDPDFVQEVVNRYLALIEA